MRVADVARRGLHNFDESALGVCLSVAACVGAS